MAYRTETDELAKARKALLKELISNRAGGDSLLTAAPEIKESASHDFTRYIFLHEPLYNKKENSLFTLEELSLFKEISEGVIDVAFRDYLEKTTTDNLFAEELIEGFKPVSEGAYETFFVPNVLPRISEEITNIDSINRLSWISIFLESFTSRISEEYENELSNHIEDVPEGINVLMTKSEPWINSTNFSIDETNEILNTESFLQNKTRTAIINASKEFHPHTVNFGLQLVYRQVWTPLGTQAGEVVKTIPLGPGQSEKVEVKIKRRRASSKSYEKSTATESSTESSSTVQDSSEVVEEASNTFTWGTEVSASANWGWGKAEISGSMGEEKSNNSKSTKSNLNEAMSKVADKLRVETKVSISTESSEEFEKTTISEIKNTNDECAVTFVYSKLQRQYEIHTYLAEVNTVVFVAERPPKEIDMDRGWFSRYAHILKRVFLDDTLIFDLNRILEYSHEDNDSEFSSDDNINMLVEKLATNGLPDNTNVPGSPPDIISSTLNTYQIELDRARAAREVRNNYFNSLKKLRNHISENSLYYGRAIWASQDPDLRIMSYDNIRVPKRWRYRAPSIDYNTGKITSPGGWFPNTKSTKFWSKLTDLINPSGPIGYAGNYLVYYFNENAKNKDVKDALGLLRTPYLRRIIQFDINDEFEIFGISSPNFIPPKNDLPFKISFNDNGTSDTVDIKLTFEDSRISNPPSKIIEISGGSVNFGNFRFLIKPIENNASLSEDTKFKGNLRILPSLEDPEITQIKWDYFFNIRLSGEDLFNDQILMEIQLFYEDLTSILTNNRIDEEKEITWGNLNAKAKQTIMDKYPFYILRAQHTRRFLLDTNNVLLTRLMDSASTLEPFKGLHRYLDVLKTMEEVQEKIFENDRRSALIVKEKLWDPDVDKTVIIKDTDSNTDVDVDI